MGETESPENSEDSDTTEGETTKEGDETEENSGNSDTPVTDDPAGNGSEDDQDVTPEQPVENPVASEGEVSDEELNTVDGEDEGITPLEANHNVAVSVGGNTATITKDSDAYKALGTGATVEFSGGLQGETGGITTDENNLVFTVKAESGYQLNTVTYSITGNDDMQDKEATVAADKKSASATIDAANITGDVAIIVTVTQLHTVTFDVADGAVVSVSDGEGGLANIADGDTKEVADNETLQFFATVSDETLYSGVKVMAGSTELNEAAADTYGTTITDDITITITPVEIWSKVTIAAEASDDVTVDFDPGVVKDVTHEIANGKDVIFKVNVLDPEKKIESVTCVYGANGAQSVTATPDGTNTYKILASEIEGLADGTALTVKVVLGDKKYEVTLPNGGSTVTWKYKMNDAAAFEATTAAAIEITSTDTITLQASVADDSTKKYSVTLGALSDQAERVYAENAAEWTITKADFVADAESLDLTAKLDVTELVTIEVKGAAEADTFDVKYFALDGEKEDEDALKADAVYVTATGNKIVDIPVGVAVYLQITAKGDAVGEVDTITGLSAAAVYGAIGTVYKVIPVTADTETANIVTVGLETEAAKVVNFTKDDQVKAVQYIPGTGTPNRVAANTIKLPSASTQVSIAVEAVENYEVAYVHTKKGEEHKAEGCGDHCITPDASGVYAITLAADAATEVDIHTKKAVVEYTVAGTDLADININIEKANASGADPVKKTGTENTYLLGSGDTYYVSATEKVAEGQESKISKIEITSQANGFKKNGNVDKYQFTAKKGDAHTTITFTVTKKANKTVSFVTTGAQLATNAIKTGAYKSLEGGEVKTKDPADYAAIAAYDVYEGTDFSFELAAADHYEIDTLTYVEDGVTKTLTPADGKYTLAGVAADTAITIKTKLKKADAYGIKIKDNPYVRTASVAWAGGEAVPGVALTVGEETLDLLTGNTTGVVNVAFTVRDGYIVDKVMAGTTEAVKPEGKAYYQITLSQGATAEVDVQVKADTNETDKYLKLIAAGSGVKPVIAVTSGLTPDENGVYKLAKTVKDEQGNVTTQGIDEIKFDVTIEAGYTLDSTAAEAAGAVKTAEADGKYSFAINAYDVVGTTPAGATSYTFTANKRRVTLKTDAESNRLESVVKYAAVGGSRSSVSITNANSSASVNNGDRIVVTVQSGDKLLVNGEAVELVNNSYSMFVELGKGLNADGSAAGDIYTFKAVGKEDYKLAYVIKHADATTESGKIDGSKLDVTYGDEVTLSLDRAYVDAKILSAVAAGEGTIASTAKVTKNASDVDVAVVDVKDGGEEFNVTVTVEKDSATEYKTTTLAPITFVTQYAPMDVTVKGIKKDKENKLDVTSRMTYPLIVKQGRATLNAADYDNMLIPEVEAANAAVADVAIENGNLIIETKTTGTAKVTIKSVTKTGEGEELFGFTVTGQDPKNKLTVKSLASSAQGMNDLYLDMTPNTAIKEVSSSAFKYYYEVNVAWKNGNDETAANHNTGYYYYLADVDDNKLQALTEKIAVNKINAETNGDKCGNTYTFSAKMIAVKKDAAITTGAPQAAAYVLKEGEFASEKATVKDFSTRNKYYEDKLGVTKKTTKIYSGQEDVLVAIPKFSAKASHIDDVNVTVCNTDGSVPEFFENDDIFARWDPDTNGIYMDVAADVYSGKYNLVIEATAHNYEEDGRTVYDMYRSTATVPFTVVNGIDSIAANAPAQIAVLNNKDASITLKPVGYGYDRDSKTGYTGSYKAATQKFTYEFVGSVNTKNNDKVIVKNNKITVKKDFAVGADPEKNKFTVRVNPVDYVGNTHSRNVTIEVTNEALVPTEIYLTDSNGEKLANNLTTLEAENAKVVVKAGNRVISNGVLNITPAYTAKKTGYYNRYDAIRVAGKASLTLKAATTDGGKKSVTRKDKYNISYPTDVTYSLYAENSNGVGIYLKNGKYQYADTGNGTLNIYVNAEVPDTYSDNAYTDYFNYSVSVKGGKIVDKSVGYGWYEIAPNAKETVVTVTDKTKKGNSSKIAFTYVNTNYKDAKAPTASTKSKLYLAYDGYGEYDNGEVGPYMKGQELKYTLKDNKDGYNAVKFTAADSKSRSIVYLEGVYEIDSKNEFVVGQTDGEGNTVVWPDAVGTAKYNLVYGTKKNGIFYPATKAAAISVKVNKLGNMKPAVKYTINPVESLGVPLTYKPADGVIYFDEVVSANVGGKKNKFYELFRLVGDDDSRKLQIKDADTYAKITAALTADAKNGNENFNPKEDLTGYLKYHYFTVNGRVDKADKITVTIKENQKVKYTASAINVLGITGAEATTEVTLGKSPVMVASAKAVSEGWTATAVKDDVNPTNKITLKCTGTPVKGKVEFYVIPADSPQKASTEFEKYGILVSANVTVLADDSTAKVKVDAKKNLTHTAEITEKTVTLTAEAVQGKEFSLVADGYAITAAARVPAGEGATEAQTKVADAVKDIKMKQAVEGEPLTPTIVIQLDRDKAIAAAVKGVITVPVKLTFDKGTVREEIISLKVKLNAVPTAADVAADVRAKLNNFALTADEIATPATAKTAMEAKAPAIAKIDPMSGIVIEKIEAKDADATKWGEGEGKSYAMVVTLKDVTKEGEAALTTAEIAVMKKADSITIAQAVADEAELIVGTKDADTTLAAKQHVVTADTTADQIADWLQAAVAKATDDDAEYALVLVEITDITEATEQATGTLTYTYKVVHTLMESGEWEDNVLVDDVTEKVTLPRKAAATP